MSKEPLNLRETFPPASRADWERLVAETAGAGAASRLGFSTEEGIDLQPLYTAADWPGETDPAGFPGLPPFTRGSATLGTRPGGWEICQLHTDPSAAGARRAIAEDVQGGATALRLRLGCGSEPGLPVATVSDLAALLEGVSLDAIAIHMEPGAAFLPAAAALAALWAQRGVAPAQVRGALGADPLGTLAAEGRLPGSLSASLSGMTALAAWSARTLPRVTALAVNTGPYHNAGASAVEELACALATGVAYLRAMTAAGLSLQAAARELRFGFAVDCDVFMSLAKLRAARTLWARIAQECDLPPEAGGMQMHAETSQRILTRRDPWSNVVRVTLAGMAAALGGAEVVTTRALDAALGGPGAFGHRIARNTQLILREESHLHRATDPAGGSWYVERLTADIAARAWAVFQEIEGQGGMAAVVTSGWLAERIARVQSRRAEAIRCGRRPITGVSDFPFLEEEPLPAEAPPARPPGAAAAGAAAAGAAALPDPAPPGDPVNLATLARDVAREPARIMEILQAALRAGAPLDALTRALATGEPAVADPLPLHRWAAPFEALRDASDAALASRGWRPRVFLVNLGSPADHSERAAFARTSCEVGGFAVESPAGFTEPAAAAHAFRGSGAAVAVVCGSDAAYAAHLATVATLLRKNGARRVLAVAHPGARETPWGAADVDGFIHQGCDLLGTLADLLTVAGVTP